MIITSSEELIHLWEQILTGTYDGSTSSTAAAGAEPASESFEVVLAEESAAGQAEDPSSGDVPAQEGPTKSQILETGSAIVGAAVSLWQSLDETVQEQMRAHASAMAQQAAMRAKSYWDALTPAEQAEAYAKAKEAAANAVARWQSLPA